MHFLYLLDTREIWSYLTCGKQSCFTTFNEHEQENRCKQTYLNFLDIKMILEWVGK